jgi:hypothetical protein
LAPALDLAADLVQEAATMETTLETKTVAPDAAPVYEVLGQQVRMPCVVREARAVHVLYPVASTVAQELVGEALEVVEIASGTAQMVLGAVDYLDNDLGQYREVMIVFFVRPRHGAGEEGTFIYRLPVDREFTCAAGRSIWGFPKTIEEIEFERGEEEVRCRLVMGGVEVFALTLPLQGGLPGETPESEMRTYTYHPTLHAVPFTSSGRGVLLFPASAGLELRLGAHPLADELRRLGLPTTPLMATWTEHFSARFGAPIPLVS